MQVTDYYNKLHLYLLDTIESLQANADKLRIRPQGDVFQVQIDCYKAFLKYLEDNNPHHDL